MSVSQVMLVFLILFYSCNTNRVNGGKSERDNITEDNYSDALPGEPVIIITDLYYPPQDDDDNFDLVMAYGLPELDVKAIILDITDAFRKPVADHPELWNDPTGPREAGIIPVMQLNYIFNRDVPFAVSPFTAMKSVSDMMRDIPGFQQQGVDLLLSTLKESKKQVQILSFGSSRVLAVAYNRDPALFREKVKMIHLNMGMAHKEGTRLNEINENKSKIAEWNVRLDVHSFVRLLRSDLPIALYPCGSWEGMGKNNTFWELDDLSFITEIDEKLQRYMDYFFRRKNQYDFLRAMDLNELPDTEIIKKQYPGEFFMWTTESWLQAANLVLAGKDGSSFVIKNKNDVDKEEVIISGQLYPCKIEVGDNGKFVFTKTGTGTPSNFFIYERSDPALNQRAFNAALPELFKTFHPGI